MEERRREGDEEVEDRLSVGGIRCVCIIDFDGVKCDPASDLLAAGLMELSISRK